MDSEMWCALGGRVAEFLAGVLEAPRNPLAFRDFDGKRGVGEAQERLTRNEQAVSAVHG